MSTIISKTIRLNKTIKVFMFLGPVLLSLNLKAGAPVITACYPGYGGCDVDRGPLGCAPEVQNGNIHAVERVLKNLANQKLSHSETLKNELKTISHMNNEAKMKHFLEMVGIESDQELIELISARDIPSKNIINLSQKLNINFEESKLALQEIAKALLGERQ